jgi:amino acid transporter
MDADKIIQLLDQISQRVGPVGNHVVELAIRQVIAESAVGLIIGLIFLVPLVIIGAVLFWFAFTHEPQNIDDDSDGAALAFGIFFGFLVVVILLIESGNIVHLLNPEWAAIEKLAQLVPGN